MLLKKLEEYAKSGIYPMHMPGHKRSTELTSVLPFSIDITEIPGFDDLSNPGEILLETMHLAAKLYSSCEAFLLTSGSTLGNLAAIGAVTKRTDKILTDSYCHKSVKNAAELYGLENISITPDIDEVSGIPGSIKPENVETALRINPGVRLVVITSPSYEGVISDIKNIAEITHKAGAILHVDCAHGAHLGFCDGFPENPVTLGADTAVMSLHKTLPALTQCSLLHICSDRVVSSAVKHMLDILQTSSPSYVLMASIDYCLRFLENDTDRLFGRYKKNLSYFYKKTTGMKRLSVLNHSESNHTIFDFDPGKIVIFDKLHDITGNKLASILRIKYKTETERATQDYVIAMTGICDPYENFKRLADALRDMDTSVG